MSTRLDLHNHTTCSDGELDVAGLCALKKGHVDIVCVTDHFPSFQFSFDASSKAVREYNRAREEEMPLCIAGMEYMLASGVEVLLFGSEGITSVMEKNPANAEELGEALAGHGAASIICHPVRPDARQDRALLSHADGIEISFMGVYLEEHEAELRHAAKEYRLNLFANADFHSTHFSRMTYSIIHGVTIAGEDDLVRCLKRPLDVEWVFGDSWRKHAL
jgi:predicted metal-dependent phosphoesterase TrpH